MVDGAAAGEVAAAVAVPAAVAADVADTTPVGIEPCSPRSVSHPRNLSHDVTLGCRGFVAAAAFFGLWSNRHPAPSRLSGLGLTVGGGEWAEYGQHRVQVREPGAEAIHEIA